MPIRNASARWQGTLRDGQGSFAAGSATHKTGRPHRRPAVEGGFSFETRFADLPGPNPEELIAAAEAACLSMALGAALDRAGKPAKSVDIDVACTLEDTVTGGYAITNLKLVVRASVPGMDAQTFAAMAKAAVSRSAVTRALSTVPIDLDASLA